eukprot:4848822-Amphidinium_carterae.2
MQKGSLETRDTRSVGFFQECLHDPGFRLRTSQSHMQKVGPTFQNGSRPCAAGMDTCVVIRFFPLAHCATRLEASLVQMFALDARMMASSYLKFGV